ncbi:COX15/CtaA family protein [Cryobacterium sp. GrIS_2_6]|uniref:COX15/CtaA family protein n=1 Tax=Cryobacterium sp. GrIS_2_6 TaxID=3162785 RepID=UPI002DFC5E4A|nr:COX15/CtaA family protein [Cryobacterium psychrotolerans]MEC5149639.1 cytochrome c oxidase assembly protein subunit 15 [Cryobacterium psychrotolerans]
MKWISEWLPTSVDRRVRLIAWVYLAAQILLVGTGGLVRLTGSGLGCPTWPKCTDGSLVNTPEMGIHGVIEFGNRLLGAVLGLVAVLAFLAVVRLRRERPDLFRLALFAGLGIPAQAVIGGISVLTLLDPTVVGLHFVISAVLVALCTAFVYRVYTGNGRRAAVVPRWYAILTHVTSAVVAITIVVGILTTGSGPHAGDENAPRNGLDSEFLQHVHSWPAYLTVALTIALVIGAWGLGRSLRTWTLALLGVEAVQVAVGLVQANTGLPAGLVGIHMVLACVLAAAMTAVVLHLKEPVALPVDAAPPVPHQAAAR